MPADKAAIGARLRAEREAHVGSRADMARLLRACSGGDELPDVPSLVSMIKDWEKGRNGVSFRYQEHYAAALGIAREMLFGDPPRQLGQATRPTAISVPRGRRTPVAPELVDYFRDQLPGHYRAEMYLGPHHLIPTVTAQTELIAELIEDAPRPIRIDLLDVGTAYAALLGWLYQDAGDLAWSSRWRTSALDLAHRSGNPQLISYALSNKAQLATDAGDGAAVVDFAQAALDGEHRLSPKVRVLAMQHQAHGYSLTGDRAEADRLLDEAASLTTESDDGYSWGNAYRRTPHYLEVQRATCYSRIGGTTASDAIRLWDDILSAMPESARRDNAVFWVRQAAALAVTPEPERVVEIATIAAGIAAETGSARLVRELLALPRRATRWADSVHARELGEIIDGVRALEA